MASLEGTTVRYMLVCPWKEDVNKPFVVVRDQERPADMKRAICRHLWFEIRTEMPKYCT